MNTSGSVKMLIVAATAALSVGAVAVPKGFVASVPGAAVADREAADATPTVDPRRKNATVAFVRSFSPDPHVCSVQIGGKFNGRLVPVRSPECAFRADL